MSPVVPMPSFTDPHLPEAAGGSINFGVAGEFPGIEAHPVEHADDYAGGLLGQDNRSASDTDAEGDRDDWTKDKWEELAEEYGLPKSGTKQEIIDRVEEHEASLDSQKDGDS